MLLKAAMAGLGVACLPENVAAPGIEQGTLVSIMPEWSEGSITTTILTTHRRGQLPAVRSVVAFLADERDVNSPTVVV